MNIFGSYPDRIRTPRFAQGKLRRVERGGSFSDHTSLKVLTPGTPFYDEAMADEFDDLIERLAAGDLLPERCYRNGIDRDSDELLDSYGIKHLHLGGSDSDVLVFVVEYEGLVVLLGIHEHTAFRGQPVGTALRSLHDNAMRRGDSLAVLIREEERVRRNDIVRKGFLERRSQKP